MTSFATSKSIALVTGGSSGLGQATAELLATKGFTVYVIDLESSIKNVQQHQSQLLHYRAADVMNEEAVCKIIEEIASNHGHLEVLVNCAGIGVNKPLFDFERQEPQKLEEIVKIVNVNLIGTLNVTRLAVGLMAKSKPNSDGQRGVIINVSSSSRKDCYTGSTPYSASKAGVSAISVPLAREFAPHGIRVVCIAPGPFKTPMNTNLKNYDEVEKACKDILVFPKRMGEPEEFARLVLCILENHYINATTIDLDGGFRNPTSLRLQNS